MIVTYQKSGLTITFTLTLIQTLTHLDGQRLSNNTTTRTVPFQCPVFLDVEIFGCRFGKYDCKNDWATKRTLYGSCKEIVPKRFRDVYGNSITAQSLSLLMPKVTQDLDSRLNLFILSRVLQLMI